MVLIHLKQSEERQFMSEYKAKESVETLIRDLTATLNVQLRGARLVEQGRQLALYGPSKPHSIHGKEDQKEEEEEEEDDEDEKKRIRGPFYNRDPSDMRTGEACDPSTAEVLRKTLSELDSCISKEQVLHKSLANPSFLKEAIQNVKGAVMICFPMGLPQYDPVQQLLNGTYEDADVMDPDTAQLWWAGKELMREKRLSDYVGNNEKTKIVAKLQVRGRAPPPREPPIDAETQKAMTAWYYKQQQEQKKLADNEDDSYCNSEWANPRALKCQFQGTSSIHYK